jgi:hypothetical protein
MVYRFGQLINGKPGFDCSSSVYFSLIAAGFFPTSQWIGNTDSLYNDLEKSGWSQVPADANGYIATQRGDIFLWGKRGASTGGAGHTGEFIDADRIIHCSYGYNGIHVDNHDWLNAINGYPELTVYRYTGASYNPPSIAGSPTDQVLEVGSTIKFDRVYTADDVQLIGDTWQVRCNDLCPKGFTWDDNGIPAEPLVEMTDNYRSSDQELEIGSKFTIPGKFTVLDLGETDGVWMALIEWNGLKFWVDVETATEIASTDAGTPTPANDSPTSPIANPILPVESVSPETPPTGNSSNNSNSSTKPKEEPMAFTQDQQKQLAVATQSLLDANEFTPVINDNVKTIAYFATDIAGVISGLVFTLLAVFHVLDGVVAVTVNAAIVAALLGLKQTFRLSSKKQ